MTKSREPFVVNIVDDERSILDSMRAFLSSHGYQSHTFQSARQFIERARPPEPECLILDLRMPQMSGLELLSHQEKTHDMLPTIVLTGHGDIPAAVQSMKLGAIDFIEKPGSDSQILAALDVAREVIKLGRREVEPRAAVAARLARLTMRERDVMKHLVLGKTNREIANELRISQRTVELHRARIRDKMHAPRLSDLIRMLMQFPDDAAERDEKKPRQQT